MFKTFSRRSRMDAIMRLIDAFDSQDSIFHAAPKFDTCARASIESTLDRVLAMVEDPTRVEYFRASRTRYAHSLLLAQKYVPKGGLLLDIGNAPGHLAIALDQLGFRVRGVNLNDCWNSTYPAPEWIEKFEVLSLDIERVPHALLPDASYDAIVFTEVLEHIAITPPLEILREFHRVLKPGGSMIFSTPNVCNISNVYALLTGRNVFWDPAIFYGSTDRHNREYAPNEVLDLMSAAGFITREFFGVNDSANWRSGSEEFVERVLEMRKNDRSAGLLLNTMVGVFGRGG